MGIVDTSYQPWEGTRQGRLRRIGALVRSGVRLSFDGMMTRLMLVGTYAMVIVFIGILYIFAQLKTPPPFTLGNNLYREYLNSGPYGLLIMLLTAVVGARLISKDIKSNATAMYFSKAITRYDYLAGKLGVIALFLLSATLLPSLTLWVGQIAMGPEELTWGQRFGDLGALTLHAGVIVIPSSAAILALSSLSKTVYLPGTLWILFYMGSRVIGSILEFRVKEDWCNLIPWQNLTAHVGNAAYAYREVKSRGQSVRFHQVMEYPWYCPAIILAAVTLIALAIVLYRLEQLERRE